MIPALATNDTPHGLRSLRDRNRLESLSYGTANGVCPGPLGTPVLAWAATVRAASMKSE